MAEKRSHKVTANRIAKRYGAEYEGGEGVDIKTPRVAIEVETAETVPEAPTQLQGHRGQVFIAGTNKEAVEKALEVTEDSTIGVMDNKGNIIKQSSRR